MCANYPESQTHVQMIKIYLLALEPINMETKPLQMWMGIIKNWSRLNASFPVCYVVRSCTIAHNHSTIQCPHVHCDRTLHPHTCITFCIGASFYFWLCRCVYIWPGSFWIKFQYLPYRVWCVLNTEFYCTHGNAKEAASIFHLFSKQTCSKTNSCVSTWYVCMNASASESKHSIILQ